MKKMFMISFLIIISLSLVSIIACGDDDDDDDRSDDDDDDDPSTLIISSGYNQDRYRIFNGDTYTHMDTVYPLIDGMWGMGDATVISQAGQAYAVFRSIPEEYGNGQLISTDLFTGENTMVLTDIDKPGMGDPIPYKDGDFLFTAVPVSAASIIMSMGPTGGEPTEYRGTSFTKAVGPYVCETTDWESPDYASSGLFASGWHCRDTEEPDTAGITAVITIPDTDTGDDCGNVVWYVENQAPSITDVCITYDSTHVIFSVGHEAEEKKIYYAKTDEEGATEITSQLNNGQIINFDCDPTSGRIVYNDLETNPNLYIVEYEVSDNGVSISSDVEQITTDSEFRRPRWVKY